MRAAAELNYQSSRSSQRSQEVITVCIFWETGLYYLSLKDFLYGVNQYVEENAVDIEYVVCPYTSSNLRQRKHHLISRRYHAMVFVGLSDDDDKFLDSLYLEVPCVFFNRERINSDVVTIDTYEVGRMAATCILKYNPSSMVFISSSSLSKRRESIRRAAFFDECSRSYMPKSLMFSEESIEAIEDGYHVAQRIFAHHYPKPGLFLTNDTLLIGFARYLYEHKIRIPDDMQMVVYCSDILKKDIMPTITLIGSPISQMSFDCMRIIDHRLHSQTVSNHQMIVHQPFVINVENGKQNPGQTTT